MSRDGSTNVAVLTLYSRAGCYLCDDMQYALARLQRKIDFQFVVEDLDTDPGWQAVRGESPVLTAGETEICHHFLDEATLRRYLQIR